MYIRKLYKLYVVNTKPIVHKKDIIILDYNFPKDSTFSVEQQGMASGYGCLSELPVCNSLHYFQVTSRYCPDTG